MKILIIEDEIDLAESMKEYLSNENYLCECATSFKQALHRIEAFDYDCILIDIMLSDGNGIELLEKIKKMKKQDGIIIVSAKNSLEDKIKSLQIGADDYLTKPFHLAELSARVFSIVRRKQFQSTNVIEQNEIKIDLFSKTVFVYQTEIILTKKEFNLLVYLIGNQNRVVSRTALAEHLSGDFADMMDNHDFVYAHIKNLKKKLTEAKCKNYVRTIYGTGYKWINE